MVAAPASAFASQPLIAGAARFADAVSALAEGDARWRRALISDIDPRACDVILDARCGQGALVVALAQAAPGAVVLGLDPRQEALDRARAKAQEAGCTLNLILGDAHDVASYVNELRFTKIVCAFTPADDPPQRRALIAAARAALAPRGALHLIDPLGPRPPLLARLLNAPGPSGEDAQLTIDMMRQAGFVGVMNLGEFDGQTTRVRLFRGVTP